jgi:hypothetical protein
MSQIQVRDENNAPVARVNIRIAEGHKSSDEAIFDILTDPSGNQGWPIPFWPLNDFTLHVNKRDVLEGYGEVEVYVPAGTTIDIPITLPSQTIIYQPPPLWPWKCATDFLHYMLWLEEGEAALVPLVLDRRGVGANRVRVLFQCHNIAHFYPQDYGDRFYTEIPPYATFLGRYGMGLEAVVYADEQNVKSGRDHWNRMVEATRGLPGVAGELVNEYPQNGVDPGQFSYPNNGIKWSRGSGLADAPPYRPGWDFFGWHGRRDWPKVTSSTEDMWYIANSKPDGWNSPNYPPMIAVHDEPMGFAEEPVPNKRSSDPMLAKLLGTASVILGAGGTFHSDDGIMSRLYGPNTRSCALAFFSGMA